MNKKNKIVLILVVIVLFILCLLLAVILGKNEMDKCKARQGIIVTNDIGLFEECIWRKNE